MKKLFAFGLAAAMTLTTMMPVYADAAHERFEEITTLNSTDYGYWSDQENFIWTFRDTGESVTIGRGTVFSDVHPDITDPEYYVKDMMLYPGEASGYDSKGNPKANYDEASVNEVRKFVNSFDWIHSDELTRAVKVYERVANGQNGNYYEQLHWDRGETASLGLLVYGHGVCNEFSKEFVVLAKAVGLEAVIYQPSSNHQDLLLKINDQWISHNPTSSVSFFDNSATFPCDYETEYNRSMNEFLESDIWKKQQKINELNDRYWAGEITYEELQELGTAIYLEK